MFKTLKYLLLPLWFICLFNTVYAAGALVFDPVVASHVVSQTAKIVEQIDILHRQLNAINQGIQQLGNAQYQWSNAQTLINQLGHTITQSNGLAYNASHLDSEFKRYFPGYKSTTDYSQYYKDLVNKTQNTFNGILQSAGSNANNFANEQSRLNFLQRQVQTARGQTQAIQSAAQISSEQVSQLQLLRQAVIAQTNAQSIYFAAQVQQQATTQAKASEVINAGSTTAPAIGHSGQALQLPDFR